MEKNNNEQGKNSSSRREGELWVKELAGEPKHRLKKFCNELHNLLVMQGTPNLAEFVSCDVTKLQICVKFVHGETLTNWLKYCPDETLVQRIALDVARALRALHFKRILHCDIHGGNVMVVEDGESGSLVDLGNSIRMDDMTFGLIDHSVNPRSDLVTLSATQNYYNYWHDVVTFAQLFGGKATLACNELLAECKPGPNCPDFNDIVEKLEILCEEEKVDGEPKYEDDSKEYITFFVKRLFDPSKTLRLRNKCLGRLLQLATKETELEQIFITAKQQILSNAVHIGETEVQYALEFLAKIFEDKQKLDLLAKLVLQLTLAYGDSDEELGKAVLPFASKLLWIAFRMDLLELRDLVLTDAESFKLSKIIFDSIFHKELRDQQIRRKIFGLENSFFALSQTMVRLLRSLCPDEESLITSNRKIYEYLGDIFERDLQNSEEWYECLTIINFFPQMQRLLVHEQHLKSANNIFAHGNDATPIDTKIYMMDLLLLIKKVLWPAARSTFSELREATAHASSIIYHSDPNGAEQIQMILDHLIADQNSNVRVAALMAKIKIEHSKHPTTTNEQLLPIIKRLFEEDVQFNIMVSLLAELDLNNDEESEIIPLLHKLHLKSI